MNILVTKLQLWLVQGREKDGPREDKLWTYWVTIFK